MKNWQLEDIPWDRFDEKKVDLSLIPVIKTAGLVEYNSYDYAAYLKSVFHNSPELFDEFDAWAKEERLHGQALSKWASLADPAYNFDTAMRRFKEGFQIPLDIKESVRGSKTGEMVARCVVETGTSSFYTGLQNQVQEPVLKLICANIAADEFRHYKFFYDLLNKMVEKEGLSKLQRLKVALSRIGETEDDELAYAYYAANTSLDTPYNRQACVQAYHSRAYTCLTPHIMNRIVKMVAKAAGLKPLPFWTAPITWFMTKFINRRQKKLQAVPFHS